MPHATQVHLACAGFHSDITFDHKLQVVCSFFTTFLCSEKKPPTCIYYEPIQE